MIATLRDELSVTSCPYQPCGGNEMSLAGLPQAMSYRNAQIFVKDF
jgi:hypothetical protein